MKDINTLDLTERVIGVYAGAGDVPAAYSVVHAPTEALLPRGRDHQAEDGANVGTERVHRLHVQGGCSVGTEIITVCLNTFIMKLRSYLSIASHHNINVSNVF